MVRNILKNILKSIGIVLISILILLAIILGYLAGSMLKVAGETPDVDPRAALEGLQENSRILDADGNLIESIETVQYREVVSYDKLPKNLVNAFIAAEDRRFTEHNGVDFIGVLATVKDYITTGDMRGASTITMQLARNVFLSSDVNWNRKIQEMILAMKMEQELTKEEIMEAYLNRIFFGQNAYGAQAAAQIYFSKDVGDLDLAQCATLAGVVKAPSYYALYSTYRPSEVTDERVLGETTINGERYLAVYNAPAYERKEYVLGSMLEEEFITQGEYNEAMTEDVAETINPPVRRADNISTYLTDLVKEQAIYVLMDNKKVSEEEAVRLLYNGGLSIYTTVDLDLQRALQKKFSNLNEVLNGDTTGWQGPLNLDLNYDEYGNIVNKNGVLQYYKRSNLMTDNYELVIPARQVTIEEDGSLTLMQGRINAYSGYVDLADYYTIDDMGILRTHKVGTIPIKEQYMNVDDEGNLHLSAEFLNQGSAFYTKNDDGSITLSNDYYQIDKEGVMQPQAAITVLDTKTGEVRAIVGGREQDSRHFLNRAASFPRAPGSAFKPISVYTGVFAAGYNQGSVQDDAPVKMIDNNPWPNNVDLRFRGIMDVNDALIISANPIAVRWLDTIGVSASKDMLTRLGIINRDHPERDFFVEQSENASVNDENLSMAIGSLTYGTTTLEMAGAYQSIGNNGKHIAPMSIAKIENNKGEIYYENKHETTEVLKPTLNYQLLNSLVRVSNESFASPYLDTGDYELASKTGTTDRNADFWFVGSTPYYTTAIWMGSDNNNLYLSGYSSVAADFYNKLSPTIHGDLEPKNFEEPEGIYYMDVCKYSGKIPTSLCSSDPRGNAIINIPVSDETAPVDSCDVHVVRSVDIRNNLLAQEGTPGSLMTNRVFLNRPFDYNPGEFNNIVPEDWKYQAPNTYSDLPIDFLPKTTRNPDKSVTTTRYREDGTKVEVTVYPDGKEVTIITSLDGTVTTTTKEPPKQESSGEKENRNVPVKPENTPVE